jgi:hypothetical protein
VSLNDGLDPQAETVGPVAGYACGLAAERQESEFPANARQS